MWITDPDALYMDFYTTRRTFGFGCSVFSNVTKKGSSHDFTYVQCKIFPWWILLYFRYFPNTNDNINLSHSTIPEFSFTRCTIPNRKQVQMNTYCTIFWHKECLSFTIVFNLCFIISQKVENNIWHRLLQSLQKRLKDLSL